MESRQEFLDAIDGINPNYDLPIVGEAFDLAVEKHEGQLRKSGEPYVTHPIAVAKILAELGMDESTLVAGLLHDVVEDTDYEKSQLAEDFGEEVALLVDGVTKLGSIVIENKEERQAENMRKMFLAMSKDIRVLIIKLADRLHNMRTIEFMSTNKMQDKCRETLDIYAPLASRLGIYTMKSELEDRAMKYLFPEDYEDISKTINIKRDERQKQIDTVVEDIKESLDDLNIPYELNGRSKHFYSIFKKMKYQRKNIDEIFDLMAVRIIVDSIKDCYAVLGIVHTMWKPLPGRFKDYIAMPKPNMYQSLHTTVIGDTGEPFEIQIRTYEMHRIAEFGIAAHWKYKEGIKNNGGEEVKLSWLRQALEWQKETNDPTEFMESLKVDLFSSQVFVFTPAGDVLELPAGATPLDFAFKVHTDVGAKCIGAKVNGKMVPIDHRLSNGDIINIITSNNASGPSVDWLKIAKSSAARTKIRQWLKKENKGDNIDKGKDLLDKYARKKGYEPRKILRNLLIGKTAKELKFHNIDDMFAQLVTGGNLISKVFASILKYYNEEQEEEGKKKENTAENIATTASKERHKQRDDSGSGIIVEGMDNLLIRVSKCCNPVPGDEIIGFITKGRGISVHRTDCVNIKGLEGDSGRFIEVEWDGGKAHSYDADINIISEDRKGVFSDLSRVCESMDIRIAGVNAKTDNEGRLTVVMTLNITDTDQMKRVKRAFKGIPGILDVYRSNG